MKTVIERWALISWSENKLDGKTEHFVFGDDGLPAVFCTRKEARHFGTTKYGYLKTRKDLQVEPFGWKLPIIVKVKIEYTTEDCAK